MSTAVLEAGAPETPIGVTGATARTAPSRARTWLDTARLFGLSRLLVWIAAVAGVLLLGIDENARRAFDAGGLSLGFGHTGNLLMAPALRWDSVWYLNIAAHGYRNDAQTSFLPLYPLLIRVGSFLTRSDAAAGLLISFVAGFVGLGIVRRLSELELGASTARTTVLLMSFGPMGFFLSAIYSEPLFLALSAGTFLAARQGRWAVAGTVGALAAATRVTGVLLAVPVILLFLYGPRTDAAPDEQTGRWRPRYPLTPALLWASLIPLGGIAAELYLSLRGFGPTATVHSQELYHSHALVSPVDGVWQGIMAGGQQLGWVVRGASVAAAHQTQGLLQVGALVLTMVGSVVVLRRLPPAYGVYVLLAILIPLSSPTVGDPLRGFARYVSVLFPLYMCLADSALRHRERRAVAVGSAALLVVFVAQFATWNVVGGLLI